MEPIKQLKVPSVEEMDAAYEKMQKDIPKIHFQCKEQPVPLIKHNETEFGAKTSDAKTSGDPFATLKKSTFYEQIKGEFKTMQNEATTAVKSSTTSTRVTSTISNKIIVNSRQRGNPVLKGISNVPWEFGEITPDYVMGRTTCALFLSVRYHSLNPNYIHERIKQLGTNYELRVLLVQVDVKDPHHALNHLMKISISSNMTLILAWSHEEAGRHLETYKMFEFKPPDILMKKQDGDNCSKVIDALTSIKSINRSDAVVLLDQFKSLEGIINASKEQLSFCPGIGIHKATNLHSVVHENFLKTPPSSNRDIKRN